MGGIIAWALSAWRWIASSRVAQAIVAAGAFFVWLKWQMLKTKRKGRQEERQEAREAAYEAKAEHEGDIHSARQTLDDEQQERRERESDENPRDRFSRQPRS